MTIHDARCDDREQGRFDSLLAILRTQGSAYELAAKCADCINRNRSRMCYPAFRAQGLCGDSGGVEAGCKSVVGARLKQSGMRGTVNGANHILALRCCGLSGGYEDYGAERAEKPEISK